MLGLEHDADAARVQFLLHVIGDLFGEPLLHLEVPGEQLDHARELGQADQPVAWHVADMGNAAERQQMVLAQRVERDVAHEHELGVLLLVRERGHGELPRGEQLEKARRDPARSVREVLVRHVPAQGGEQFGHRRLGTLDVDTVIVVDDGEPWARPQVELALQDRTHARLARGREYTKDSRNSASAATNRPKSRSATS